MTRIDDHPDGRTRPHWSFWLIAVLAVAWNAFGAYDYLMTQFGGRDYLEQMLAEEQVEAYLAMSSWAVGAWALAVWSSVLASLALLLRRTWAVPLFGLSLLAMLVSFFHQLVLMGDLARQGIGAAIFPGAIVAIGVFLLSFAIRQSRAGILR